MGKGGGCVSSKPNKHHKSTTSTPPPPQPQPQPLPPQNQPTITPVSPQPTEPPKKPKIFIVFYSMYGHVEALAKKMKAAIDSSLEGVVEATLYRVPETLSDDILSKMRAPSKDDNIPVMDSVADLAEADGFLFGFPTRYGAMAAQMKAFFDSTGHLWKDQKLAGKPAGFFVSTGTQGGGQETTAWTAITQLAHHGMLFVPIGYTFGAGMFKMDSIRGGSPYGAGVFAGDGTREPTEAEIALAEHQGKYMASVIKKLSAE